MRTTVTLDPETEHLIREAMRQRGQSFKELLAAAGSYGGNLVTDAQIAELAIAHRAEVHTADHDFQRFPGLDCRFPLVA